MEKCGYLECPWHVKQGKYCEGLTKGEKCSKFKPLIKKTEPVAEVPCSVGLSDFVSLADELEKEGEFLDNPHDSATDRAAGQAYKYCVERIRTTIEKKQGR